MYIETILQERCHTKRKLCPIIPLLCIGYMPRDIKQFELLEIVFDSTYVDLLYDEIYRVFTVGYVYLYNLCSCVVVFVVVFVPYADVVAVVRVMLFCCIYVY